MSESGIPFPKTQREFYQMFREDGDKPFALKDPEKAHVVFPHIHRVFGNLKAWLIGTHHGVSKKHIQTYLNEYVFRFNRRFNPMLSFNSMLGIAVENEAMTYEELYHMAEGKNQ